MVEGTARSAGAGADAARARYRPRGPDIRHARRWRALPSAHHVRGRLQGDAVELAASAQGAGGLTMPAMSMVQALNSAMDVMLERDPKVLIFGEDVGFYGGVFRVTEGLQKKHGESRVFDAPIAEGGML